MRDLREGASPAYTVSRTSACATNSAPGGLWELGGIQVAKSLAIGNPADGYYTLKIMAETGGAGETGGNASKSSKLTNRHGND